jgi:hypothetical protein
VRIRTTGAGAAWRQDATRRPIKGSLTTTGPIAIEVAEAVEVQDEHDMRHAFYRQALRRGPGLGASFDPSRVGDGFLAVGGSVGVHG